MAASVVSHILSDPTVFSSWPHYEGKESHTRCRLMVFMAEGTLPPCVPSCVLSFLTRECAHAQ